MIRSTEKANHQFYTSMTIQEAADIILKTERLGDWRIDWWISPPSECWPDIKLIIISESYKDQPVHYQYEILLHEIAHAVTGIDHDHRFYKVFGRLLTQYSNLFTEIDNALNPKP